MPMSAQTISPQKGAELGAVCRGLQLSNVTVRTFFIGKPSFGGFGKFSPKTKKARSSFCSERTASERAMYGEK